MKTTNFLTGVLGAALSCELHLKSNLHNLSNRRLGGNAVLAQDFATHGMYTEPTTGISFYTSVEGNGAVTGDGEFSQTSVGGFTFGVALPGDAATVDSSEYIGIIVCSRNKTR